MLSVRVDHYQNHKDLVPNCNSIACCSLHNSGVNPLPDMPILGPSNSAANKDTMSKIWTNGDTII